MARPWAAADPKYLLGCYQPGLAPGVEPRSHTVHSLVLQANHMYALTPAWPGLGLLQTLDTSWAVSSLALPPGLDPALTLALFCSAGKSHVCSHPCMARPWAAADPKYLLGCYQPGLAPGVEPRSHTCTLLFCRQITRMLSPLHGQALGCCRPWIPPGLLPAWPCPQGWTPLSHCSLSCLAAEKPYSMTTEAVEQVLDIREEPFNTGN
jgi:hypothetical protein